jgi:IS1 family transposase
MATGAIIQQPHEEESNKNGVVKYKFSSFSNSSSRNSIGGVQMSNSNVCSRDWLVQLLEKYHEKDNHACGASYNITNGVTSPKGWIRHWW